jgi:hypothetical protein
VETSGDYWRDVVETSGDYWRDVVDTATKLMAS